MQLYNAEAYKDWSDNALEPCPNCSRRFLPDRLVVHLRSCKTPIVKEPPGISKLLMPSAKIRHEPLLKEEKKVKKKPESFAAILKAAKGAKVPKMPDMVIVPGGKGASAIVSKKKVGGLEPADIERKECPSCGRKFAADRLDVHYNICGKGKKDMKKDMNKGAAAFKPTFD